MFNLEESSPSELIEEVYNLHMINPEFIEKTPKEDLIPELISTLWNLVEEGEIHTDLTIPLTMKSRIWYIIPSAPVPTHKPSFFNDYDK